MKNGMRDEVKEKAKVLETDGWADYGKKKPERRDSRSALRLRGKFCQELMNSGKFFMRKGWKAGKEGLMSALVQRGRAPAPTTHPVPIFLPRTL
ncbi:MAG: hypothetical protein U1F77_09730 [Kiritimatiellia bacterium]